MMLAKKKKKELICLRNILTRNENLYVLAAQESAWLSLTSK